MNQNTRQALFWTVVVFFLTAGIGAVLYSQGWRLQLSPLRVQKVGALYIRTYPQDAHIMLNGKEIRNESWLLQQGTFINNLTPKSYSLRLSREGFEPWTQTIVVTPSHVTELKYAVLVPTGGEELPRKTPDKATGVWTLGDNTTIISSQYALERNGAVTTGTVVAATPQDILVKTKATEYVFLHEAAEEETITVAWAISTPPLSPKTPYRLFLVPGSNRYLLVSQGKNLVIVNLYKHTLQLLSNTQSVASEPAVKAEMIAWIEKMKGTSSSTLVVYDPESEAVTTSTLAFTPKILHWISHNTLALIDDDNTAYRYRVGTDGIPEKISSYTRDITTDTSGKFMALLENNSLEIIGPAPQDYRRFALPNQEQIQSVSWYGDSHHLFVQYPDRLKFLDTDDIRLEHIQDVGHDSQTYVYNPNTNHLLVVSRGGKVYQLEFPHDKLF